MNTRKPLENVPPLLIARIQAGDAVLPYAGGDILVHLIETDGDPLFRISCAGGELPEHLPREYPTAQRALRVAFDLTLTVIYDEVTAITETGEEDDEDAGTRETGGSSI